MASGRSLFLISIAVCVLLVNVQGQLTDAKNKLADAKQKLQDLYGSETLDEVNKVLKEAGKQINSVVGDTIPKIKDILSKKDGGDGANADVADALNGLKESVGQVLSAAKQGAQKALKKLD